MVVHEHGHPHVLLLQIANAFFKLPGDYLKPQESNEEGLKMRMHEKLGPESAGDAAMNGSELPGPEDWQVGEAIGQYFRPNFESFMVRKLTVLLWSAR